MNTSNSNSDHSVGNWYKKQLELRGDYLEMLIKQGYSQEQTGFDLCKQLTSIRKEIKELEKNYTQIRQG